MFTATFYSYKGGVGRTLALANVAYVLADRGSKVLIVDFDLEAPGLPTLDAFKRARSKPGIIDYVNTYLRTDRAPDVGKFIQTAKIKRVKDKKSSTLEIDVMPAGGRDDTYAGKFAAIDWINLYSKRSGFLLIEELREAWQKRGYDYVLIDSRTGHTDVGGICTRQLPDLVAMIFFPNEQNFYGLNQIVRTIRDKGARGKKIDMLFVASRVPRLDDEHGVLKGWLDKFRTELDYKISDSTIIEHYDSLSLLNQILFVSDRPQSGLASQYRNLATLISQHNMEDPRGAFQFLRSLSDADRSSSVTTGDQEFDIGEEEILRRLLSIAGRHETDSVIQFEVARAFYARRRIAESLVAADLALAGKGNTKTNVTPSRAFLAGVHHLRLKAFSEIGSYGEVAESARAILSEAGASGVFVIDAILALAKSEPNSLYNLRSLAALQNSSAEQLANTATKLFASTSAVEFSAEILEMALEDQRGWRPDKESLVQCQLILVAGGNFELAARLTEICDPDWMEDLAAAFNYCMADWALQGRPDLAKIEAILPLFDEYVEAQPANLNQCFAICNAVLGRLDEMEEAIKKSRDAIRLTNRREFSCWTYSNVLPPDFEIHLDLIQKFGRGSGPPPEFLSRAKH